MSEPATGGLALAEAFLRTCREHPGAGAGLGARSTDRVAGAVEAPRGGEDPSCATVVGSRERIGLGAELASRDRSRSFASGHCATRRAEPTARDAALSAARAARRHSTAAPLLQDKGKVSALEAKLKAEAEYDKYRVRQDREYISDFDREVERIQGLGQRRVKPGDGDDR